MLKEDIKMRHMTNEELGMGMLNGVHPLFKETQVGFMSLTPRNGENYLLYQKVLTNLLRESTKESRIVNADNFSIGNPIYCELLIKFPYWPKVTDGWSRHLVSVTVNTNYAGDGINVSSYLSPLRPIKRSFTIPIVELREFKDDQVVEILKEVIVPIKTCLSRYENYLIKCGIEL
jgi:hypothetical protein